MLELRILRDHKDRILKSLGKREMSVDFKSLVESAIRNDDIRKKVQTEQDLLLAKSNQISKTIGLLYKSGKTEEAEQQKIQVSSLKSEIQDLDQKLKEAKEEIYRNLLEIPNVPNTTVPNGSSESDNEIVKDWNSPFPKLPKESKPHWELADEFGIFDLKLGVKITGSGFPVFTGPGAILQRALINFFLDQSRAAGYKEIGSPILVNEDTARATGQLPDKEAQMYYVEKDNLYLIPTSEVPVTNIYRNEVVNADQLPIKLTAYSPCFRREAGSYGAHVKGLNRVHQFDKVEIVQVVDPSKSYEALDDMCNYVSGLLDKLELPYRIVRLCGGDLGFASALTYDFEVFSAAQEKWLEVSSVSNFETFQSNRLKLKVRDKENNRALAHTLNGSALALPRTIAAILENFQTGSAIQVPEVLRSYTGFDQIEKK